jgi:energy-coupling factor transporter ATP-binding protein EcfA2
MTTLGDHYLSTDEYQRAFRGEVNLVVGRKGSGKTALFVQLRNTKRERKPNIVRAGLGNLNRAISGVSA